MEDDVKNEFPKAFPLPENYSSGGMTLRDYFAAQAMVGWMIQNKVDFADTWTENLQTIATTSYELADAMLLERDKP